MAAEFVSSYVSTAGSAVTRSADSLSVDISGTPLATPQEITAYCKFVERGTVLSPTGRRLFRLSNTGAHIVVDNNAGGGLYRLIFNNGTVTQSTTLSTSPTFGDTVEIRAVLRADGSLVLGQSVNGAVETTSEDTTTASLPSGWGANGIALNEDGDGTNTGFADFISVKIASGVHTMDEMRALDDASSEILFQTDFTLTAGSGGFVELDMGDGTIEDEAGNSEVSSMDTGSDFPWHLEPVRGEQQSGDYPLIEVTDGRGSIEFLKRWL